MFPIAMKAPEGVVWLKCRGHCWGRLLWGWDGGICNLMWWSLIFPRGSPVLFFKNLYTWKKKKSMLWNVSNVCGWFYVSSSIASISVLKVRNISLVLGFVMWCDNIWKYIGLRYRIERNSMVAWATTSLDSMLQMASLSARCFKTET